MVFIPLVVYDWQLIYFVQMAVWKLDDIEKEDVYGTKFHWFVVNKQRNKELLDLGLEGLSLSRKDFFRYFTFLHMSGMNEGSISPETIFENLEMIKGPYYSKQTLEEMEAPLRAMIKDLRHKLSVKDPDSNFLGDIEQEVIHRLSLGARKNHRVERDGKRKNRYTCEK